METHSPRLMISTTRAALLLLGAGSARADMAPPPSPDYEIKVDGTTVKIYLIKGGTYEMPCTGGTPGEYAVVRENVSTKEVYLLPLYCETDSGSTEYIADYCVPPGKYRYGMLKPLDCPTDLYADVEVTETKTCSNDPRKLPPKKSTSPAPWDGKDKSNYCSYPDDDTGCSVAGSAAQVGLGGLLLLLVGLSRRRRRRGTV